MPVTGHDTLQVRRTLTVGDLAYDYFSIPEAEKTLGDLSRLPFSLRVLLENLLRFEDGRSVTVEHLKAMRAWLDARTSEQEIAYRPARVLMQDFTGVPAVVDLAAMRDAMKQLGGDPQKINPLVPVHLVIDHSVMVDAFGTPQSFGRNVELEYARNGERYEFLKWGATAFDNFKVVPPGTGICHQVNLEYIAQCVWTAEALHRVAHGGKVDHRRNAGEVLHQHTGGAILDLAVDAAVLLPVGHRLHVRAGDGGPVLEAEEVFQKHLHRERQARHVA